MGQIDVDAIIADLRRRVDERRATGDYPPGLEEQLEAEFEAIMKGVHRDDVDTEVLSTRVSALFESAAAITCEVQTTSGFPGGAFVHGLAGRVIQRHTGQLAAATRTLGQDIALALREVQLLLEAQRNADVRQLREVIASVIDRIALLDHVATAIVDLERRVDALEVPAPPST